MSDDLDDLNDLADRLFSDRAAGFTSSHFSVILAHVGALGDGGKLPPWYAWPLEDQRGQFWSVDLDERAWLKFAPARESVCGTAGQLDQGSRREHPRCRLLSWQSARRVYRGEQLALVVAENASAAGVLLIFRSEQEVRLTTPGRAVQTPPRAHGSCPAAESAVPIEELHRITRAACKRLAAVDLRGGGATPREAARGLLRNVNRRAAEVEEPLVERGLLTEAEVEELLGEEPKIPQAAEQTP